jgi:glycosyltransferase involved in cell wall biosynthesis
MSVTTANHGYATRTTFPVYQKWIERYEPTADQLQEVNFQDHKLRRSPKISIVTPVFNPDQSSLVSAIESVLTQTYENWELCLADDGSTKPYVSETLQSYARRDKRVKVAFSEVNKGISAASNLALSMATGDFIALMDHDDELAPFALHEVARLLQHNKPDIVYSDEDKVDLNGLRYDPYFKPDWSPDFLLSHMYPGHLGVYRRALVAKLGGFRDEMSGSQDYDLFLRSSELASSILHIPKILYHWRAVPGSAASSVVAKEWALRAGKRALQDTMRRRGEAGKVEDGMFDGIFRYRRDIKGSPTVSIVIVIKQPSDCVDSVESIDTQGSQKILITPDVSSVPSEISKRSDVRVVKAPDGNYPRMYNNAAKVAEGEHLLFLGSGVTIQGVDSLRAMLEHSQRSEVGAVGGKILADDGTVAHAATVLGLSGVAGTAFKGFDSRDPGYFTSLNLVRNCTAVSGSCFMVKRSLFTDLNGFDTQFDSRFYDVDFCLRATERKLYNVYTPYAVSKSKSVEEQSEQDAVKFVDKWGARLEQGDSYYNRNLSLAVPYEIGYPLFGLDKLPNNSAALALVKDYARQLELQMLFPPNQAQSFKRLLDWGDTHYTGKKRMQINRPMDELRSQVARSKPWFA